MIKKPMLAISLPIEELRYPLLATPKLDGIRCVIVNGKALSRKLKPIPNDYIREFLEKHCGDGMDGEIICPNATFNETQSLVMSEDGSPDFLFYVFDKYSEDQYKDRVMSIKSDSQHIKVLLPVIINNINELNKYIKKCEKDGYEGVITRTPDSMYKNGRATPKSQWMVKIKKFADSEAKVIGFEERMKNNNVLQKDNLGHSKRSSHKEHLEPSNTLGALVVEDIKTKITFKIGTGFDDVLRKTIWDNKDSYIGKLVTYTYQPSGGKDKPRFPSFKGFRNINDIS